MTIHFRRLASWLVPLLLLPIAFSTAVVTAQPATPTAMESSDLVESVTSATIEFSRSIENGQQFDLYDRMHTDARNVFPRQAFFAWFDAGGLPTPVDDPVVTDTLFAPWTFSLIDETYDDAVVVTYTQTVERDGLQVEESGSLVLVPDGLRWRWFPVIDQKTIDLHLEQAATERSSSIGNDFRRAAFIRIDRFWADVLDEAGLPYEPLRNVVAVTTDPFETGCGLEENIAARSIYYCTLDETVYYDPDFEDEVVQEAGAYSFTMIVSHEWAHHIQWDLGIDISRDPELDGGLYPIELELQADCLAGVYAQDALANGDAGWAEIRSAMKVTSSAGDRANTDWDDWDAHGSSDQRVEAFQVGFDDGFWGCNLDLDGDILGIPAP